MRYKNFGFEWEFIVVDKKSKKSSDKIWAFYGNILASECRSLSGSVWIVHKKPISFRTRNISMLKWINIKA